MAALIVLISFLLLLNLGFIANAFMDINGMSPESLHFMMGAGKWLFTLMMGLSALVLVLNGYYLVKFGRSAKLHSLHQGEVSLSDAFVHLGKYLMITAILSLLSTISTIAAIFYYVIK
jgi:hypothetical protein